MEVLAVVIIVISLLWLVVSLLFLRLTWTTLLAHRRAMDALHQHLARQAAARAPSGPGGQF